MRIIFLLLIACFPVSIMAQEDFDKYFSDKVLRFDFIFAGNNIKTVVYPADMKEEPFYGGSKTNLVDPFDYGNFKYELFDLTENKLIYSRGFSTLFQEWQSIYR